MHSRHTHTHTEVGISRPMGIEKPPSKTLNPPPPHGLGKTTVGEMHMLLQHVDAQMSFELTHRQTYTPMTGPIQM